MTGGTDEREPDRRRPVDWVDLGEIGQPAAAEEIGTGDPTPRRQVSRPRTGVVVVAVLVVLAFVAALLREGDGRSTADAHSVPTISATGSVASPTSDAPVDATDRPPEVGAPPRVVQLSPHLLGVQSGWELFGRGSGVVVRVQPAAGRMTLTTVPELASSGPVAFLAGEAGAIIRPLDEVPGYLVPDGASAAPLSGLLKAGGAALPGPDLRQVWVDGGAARRTSVVLTDFDGTATGVRMVIPSTAIGPVASDGDGYVMFSGIGGVYDVRPGGVDRITAGTPVAVGAQRVLAIECSDQYSCSTVVLGLVDGSRRVIGAGFPPTYSLGVISPDGRTAAVPDQLPDGGIGLRLFDLENGRSRLVHLDLNRELAEGAAVWAPDSSLLFALDAEGRVAVVNAATAAVRSLGVALPPLSQLAIRPQVASSG